MEWYEDIIETLFGRLTVKGYLGKKKIGKKTRHFYECECICGKKCVVDRTNLKDRHTKSCGCLKKQRGKNNKGWTGHEGISGYFWNRLKSRKRRSRVLPFEITIEYAWELFENQNFQCALTGLSIAMAMGSRNGTWTGTASLDRINSDLGYVEGNVQWVHKDVNQMKWTLSQDRFIEVCKMVVEKHGCK